MPKMGYDMTSGVLVKWLKHPGDAVERGEAVADGKRFKSHIDPVQCSGCDLCRQTCKFGAIKKIR